MGITGGQKSSPVSYFQLNPSDLSRIVLYRIEEGYRAHGITGYYLRAKEIEGKVRQDVIKETGNYYTVYHETRFGELVSDSLGIVGGNLDRIKSERDRQIMGFNPDFKDKLYDMILARILDNFLDGRIISGQAA